MSILAALKVAEKKKKKIVNIKTIGSGVVFLTLLWREGFILGFLKKGFLCVTIFLKPGLFFARMDYYPNKPILTWKKIKELSIKNPNSFFLILTPKGIVSHSGCIEKRFGGVILYKI